MSTNKSLKDWSRIDWHHTSENSYPGDNNVQLGAMLRIADAAEKMASNYTQLQNEKERYERWYKEEAAKVEGLRRRVAALKGHINRLKKSRVNP